MMSATASGATACASRSGVLGMGLGGVELLRRDGVHPDTERAQLQVEHPGEVDKAALLKA